MELKVVCQCGQKYKFDVEPVNGRMPFKVNCPVCNQDGTFTANMMLAEVLASPPPPPAIATPPPAGATPSSSPNPPPPQPVGSVGGLRLSRSAPPPGPATEPQPEGQSTGPGPMRPYRSPAAARAAVPDSKKASSFGMGLLGGFIGALVGVVIYFLVFKFTGLRFKLLAVGVGALAGWLAEVMGRGEGSKELGALTAVFVLAGIIGAQYFVALGWWHEFRDKEMKAVAAMYDQSVAEARKVVKAIPTGSDAEIRAYLVKRAAKEDGEKLNPATISQEDIRLFRKLELKEDQKLASGKISREQFNKALHLKTSQTAKEKQRDDSTFKGVFMLLLMSKMNVISLIAAVGIAFKFSTNA